MSRVRRLLSLGSVLVLMLAPAGCVGDKQQAAHKKLQQAGVQNLRRDAALFYKELFVTSGSKYFIPKVDAWPKTFRHFDPILVRAYPDGFSLAINDDRGSEEGLYVVPLGMDRHPVEGRTAHFKKIDEGIYWYSFSEK